VFSIKYADTSEQKSNFSKNFNLLSQIELRESRVDIRGLFPIKSAGSSNYRGVTFFASGNKKLNIKLVLSVACPERIEFTLSVIEGNVVVVDPD